MPAPMIPVPRTVTRGFIATTSSNRFGRWSAHSDFRGDDLADAPQRLLIEPQAGRRDGVIDVPWIARADDRDLYRRVGKRPGDRETADGGAELELRETRESVDDAQVSAIQLALEHVALRAPVARRELRVGIHRAAQQPMRERAVDEHPDVVSARVGQDGHLDLTAEEVVRRLQGLDLQARAELLHLRGVEVGDADVANLARGHYVGEGFGGVREGRLRVRPVDLIEVDVVGAEGLQALVHAASHPVGAGIAFDAASWSRPQPALGRDDDLVTRATCERLGDQSLGGAEAIALSCVEEVDALVGCMADGGDRG